MGKEESMSKKDSKIFKTGQPKLADRASAVWVRKVREGNKKPLRIPAAPEFIEPDAVPLKRK